MKKMKKMKKNYYYLVVLLMISIVSCEKKSVTPEVQDNLPVDIIPEDTIQIIDTPPSISLSEPDDNFYVGIGEIFYLEGLAADEEELSAIVYTIETPEASYNYIDSNNITATGSIKDFNELIEIPADASIGSAVLNVYCVDTNNNQSSIITRNFRIKDVINPTITRLKDSIGSEDLIKIHVFQNLNNIVDSVVVFNETRSENIAIVKDIGGFKTIICSLLDADIMPVHNEFYDLRDSNEPTYEYQIDINGLYPGSTFVIGFREFDSMSADDEPYAQHSISFKY